MTLSSMSCKKNHEQIVRRGLAIVGPNVEYFSNRGGGSIEGRILREMGATPRVEGPNTIPLLLVIGVGISPKRKGDVV